MLRYLKPYTGPAVLFLLGTAVNFTPVQSPLVAGILIGIACFWLLMALASDRNLARRFPGLVDWMPFLASLGEPQVFAGRQELERRHITHKTLRLVDLASLGGIIHEKTVEDCEIYGPAMLILTGATAVALIGYAFEGDPRSLFIVVSPTQEGAQGGIALSGHCVFRHCTFRNIAFLGPQSAIDQTRAGFGS